ncbi:MAG TPA: hypothetical protein VK472_01195 [Allosphingosinicella sp.]|nr:hypothetical protein [Allosphingosinicella sp.]
MRWLLALLTLLAAGCASMSGGRESLDSIAADYVRLQLEIGEKEPGYIDAYYGPAEWQTVAKLTPRTLPELAVRAAVLQTRLAAVRLAGDEPEYVRRRDFLQAQLKAASTRLRMLQGEKLGFADEAEGLFGVRPELKPLSSFDPVLARIERLVPGPGPLWQRVDSYQERFSIPKDRLEPVMQAAIAECKRRSAEHIALPPNERFTLELVSGKSWGGYNWYKGDANSLIQVNTDLPVRISRAVDLGCHEGYPGHHALNTLLEQRMVKEKGWVEYSVYPLFSPQSFIAEGSANYGVDLAFPGDERLRFETATLYPLAGLPAAEAGRYLGLLEATKELGPARFTIAADYLEGRLDREQALDALQKYQVTSRRRAEQSLSFIDQYRSYVINYGLGEQWVRAYVEAAGADPESRWRAMERVISEPTLPGDLAVR